MSALVEKAPPPAADTVVAKPLRIRHVDSLRAIAAGLVVWTHFAEVLFTRSSHRPSALDFLSQLPRTLVLGRLGVDLFFAISGFVICRSFGGAREGSSRRFLIRRVCRLYPAFWVSIPFGMIMWWLDGRAVSLPMLAANATMAPITLGEPMLIGLYWTLNIELVFYGLCLVLHWTRQLDRPGTLAACAALLAAGRRTVHLVGHLAGHPLDLPGEGGVWLISLGLMFWGALFRCVYEETGGFRRGLWRCRPAWLLLLVSVAMLDLHDPHLKTVLLRPWSEGWGERMVTLNSLGLFTLWVALLRVETRVLTYVGVISYSLYLFHPPVLVLLDLAACASSFVPPLWLLLVLGTAASVAVAAVAYHWVEAPAIAFGKRWVARGQKT